MNSVYKENHPHGIMFHHFHNSVHPVGQGSISADQFEDLIKFVGRERILSAEEWLFKANQSDLSEGDLCITFDDNLRCQYDIAVPVMKTYDIKPFWFVYSSVIQGNLEWLEIYRYFRSTQFENIDEFYNDFFKVISTTKYDLTVEKALADFVPANYLKGFSFYTDEDKKFRYVRDQILGISGYNSVMDTMLKHYNFNVDQAKKALWMNEENLSELFNAGHVIGLHSYSHPTNIAGLSYEQQANEYNQNFEHLHKVLGAKPISMSHPCNSYQASTLNLLEEMGIQLGFRANMQNLEGYTNLEMPREDHSNIIKSMSVL